jgi:uncharacterized protein YbjT (DUF2867 family)
VDQPVGNAGTPPNTTSQWKRIIIMILVTGATGNVGRELVKLLLAEAATVAAVTRDPAKAALPAAARVVGSDPSTLLPALGGVEAIFLVPRAVGNATAELLSFAVRHGVRRVVVVSAVTVEYGGGYKRFAEAFKAVEDASSASGLLCTFLRCAQFDTNALIWAPQIHATGVIRGAYGDATASPIHPRDIAAVGVRALLDDGHGGQAYALTGPESLSQRDQVRLIGEAIGVDLLWEEVPPKQVRQAMIAQGTPEEIPDRMLGYLAECLRQPGPSTTVVQDVLGRAALTFAEWAKENTAAFRN